MKTIQLLLLCILFFPLSIVWAQKLTPGFDNEEYRELIYVATRSTESPDKAALIPPPTSFTLAYESPSMGLDNERELWTNNQATAVICIRGTTLATESWLANLYVGMVTAKGKLMLSNTNNFKYELSSHSRAAVHIGYLISTAFLAEDILSKIDSIYESGIKDILIMGHTQGGAISYLLTSHLYSDYVRTGTTIVLTGDDAYYKSFPNDSKDFFIDHSFPPYLYLLDRLTL